jgi:hypothetical protein
MTKRVEKSDVRIQGPPRRPAPIAVVLALHKGRTIERRGQTVEDPY